jgi:hypothetical protein
LRRDVLRDLLGRTLRRFLDEAFVDRATRESLSERETCAFLEHWRKVAPGSSTDESNKRSRNGRRGSLSFLNQLVAGFSFSQSLSELGIAV